MSARVDYEKNRHHVPRDYVEAAGGAALKAAERRRRTSREVRRLAAGDFILAGGVRCPDCGTILMAGTLKSAWSIASAHLKDQCGGGGEEDDNTPFRWDTP